MSALRLNPIFVFAGILVLAAILSACANGEVRCTPGTSEGLDKCVNGQWAGWETCLTGQTCSNGVCVGGPTTCSNPNGNTGDYACLNNNLDRCSPPDWSVVKACQPDETCQLSAQACWCNPGSVRNCAGGANYQTCNAGTGAWQAASCPDGQVCQNGACQGNSTDCTGPAGKNGDTRCKDASTAQVCANGQWQDNACLTGQVCQSGVCTFQASTACTPGERRCAPDGGSVQACIGGNWLIDTGCTDGYSCQMDLANRPACLCNAGTAQCVDSNTLQICNRGYWTNSTCAEGQVCQNNACVLNTNCANPAGVAGNKYCADATELMICQDGLWTHYSYCASNAICRNNACVLNVNCTNPAGIQNDRSCLDANTPQVCDTGNWVPATPCAAGQACVGGTCQGTSNDGGNGSGNTGGTTGGSAGVSGGGNGGAGGGGGTGGGEKPSASPCVGWTPPSIQTQNKSTQTNSAGQTRTCTTTNTMSYCKTESGEVDTGRSRPESSQSCSGWTGQPINNNAQQSAASPPGSQSVFRPQAVEQAGNGWLQSSVDKYGLYLLPVVLVAALGLFLLFAMRRRKREEDE